MENKIKIYVKLVSFATPEIIHGDADIFFLEHMVLASFFLVLTFYNKFMSTRMSL